MARRSDIRKLSNSLFQAINTPSTDVFVNLHNKLRDNNNDDDYNILIYEDALKNLSKRDLYDLVREIPIENVWATIKRRSNIDSNEKFATNEQRLMVAKEARSNLWWNYKQLKTEHEKASNVLKKERQTFLNNLYNLLIDEAREKLKNPPSSPPKVDLKRPHTDDDETDEAEEADDEPPSTKVAKKQQTVWGAPAITGVSSTSNDKLEKPVWGSPAITAVSNDATT